jgi:hypothetical protein
VKSTDSATTSPRFISQECARTYETTVALGSYRLSEDRVAHFVAMHSIDRFLVVYSDYVDKEGMKTPGKYILSLYDLLFSFSSAVIRAVS